MAVAFCPSSTVTAGALPRASPPGGCFLFLRSRGARRLQPAVTLTTRSRRTWCAVIVGSTAVPEASTEEGRRGRRSEQLALPPELVDELVEEALVWCSQHGLVVGDKNHPVKSHY